MRDKAAPVGWVVKVMTSRLGGGQPAVKTFDVTYPDRASAQEAVKRHCGSDYYEIVAVEELVATDLGPNKVRAR